jgi:hypothetical protein
MFSSRKPGVALLQLRAAHPDYDTLQTCDSSKQSVALAVIWKSLPFDPWAAASALNLTFLGFCSEPNDIVSGQPGLQQTMGSCGATIMWLIISHFVVDYQHDSPSSHKATAGSPGTWCRVISRHG